MSADHPQPDAASPPAPETRPDPGLQRRPRPRRSGAPRPASSRRGPVAAAIVIALLAVAAAATVLAPTDDEVQSPIENRGGTGELVASRQAAVEVTGVAAARGLDVDGGGPEATTTGAWVVVDLTVTCRLRTCAFEESFLRIDGRSYGASTLLGPGSFTGLAGEPGVPYESVALFEIPADAFAEGRADLVLQPSRTTALDSVAVVELDLPQTLAETARVRSTSIEGAR